MLTYRDLKPKHVAELIQNKKLY